MVISKSRATSIFINLLITILFFLLYQLSDKQDLRMVTILGIFQYTWMISTWYYATRNLINVYLLFLALTFFFYMGQPVLYLFGIEVTRVMTIETSPFTLTQVTTTLIFLLKAMALFHLGASFAVKKVEKKKEAKNSTKAILFAGIVLFAISAIPQINFTVTSLRAMLTMGYSSIFSTDFLTGTGLEGGIPRFLSGFFKASLLLLILGNKDNRRWRRFWVAFSVAFSLIMIISGQRGENALFIIGVLLTYHYAIKPFTKRHIVNFAWISLFSLFAFSVISTIRNIGVENYSFGEIVSEITKMNFLADVLAETGYTLLTCTTVMVYSPYSVPFNNGATYFNSLFSLIPNLFWDVNPAAVGSVDQVFSRFLTQYGGIGSSFIIEGYYNFGYYSLLIMPLFGYMLGKIYFSIIQSSLDRNYVKLYVYIYLPTIVLWYVRSDTVTFWRNFGYHAIFPVFLVLLYTLYANRKRQRTTNFHFSNLT